MATVITIQDFSEQVARGIHQFGTHTFRLALCSAAPVGTNTQLTNLTQIAYTNITGGVAPAVTIGISEAAGVTTVTGNQVDVVATGAVPPFQYYALYNDTATNKNLVMAWNHGSVVTLAAGETFSIKFNNTASAGTIFTLT